MSRIATTTPEQVRSTILAMLAEAHESQPASRERFRRVVSVRKLRERLGAGDPGTLGRAINEVEAELVQAGLADIALPDIPAEIADLMRQVWQAAVSVQLDEVMSLKTEARQTVEATQATLVESTLRVDVLKQELAELRTAAVERDSLLAQLRTDHAALTMQYATSQDTQQALQLQLQAARTHSATLEQTHADALSSVQLRYEGLSKQLLQETAQQRQAQQDERGRLASQLKFAERRIATLESSLQDAESELAKEREQRHKLAGEASAFKAVNASQRAQLDELMRAALAPPPVARKRAESAAAKPTSVTPKPVSKSKTPK
jgi:chromosome segregation ATPase